MYGYSHHAPFYGAGYTPSINGEIPAAHHPHFAHNLSSHLPHAHHIAHNHAFNQLGLGLPTADLAPLYTRFAELQNQVNFLSEIIKLQNLKAQMPAHIAYNSTMQNAHLGWNNNLNSQINNPYVGQFSVAPWSQMGVQPLRVRESDSSLFLEIYLPELTMGDVEVEIVGARILCRTRVPVSPNARWWTTSALPRGLDFFELPDGRIEFSWIAPVSFSHKDVEATWKEGFLCVCLTKSENVVRHSVKIAKDTSAPRRSVSDMNS